MTSDQERAGCTCHGCGEAYIADLLVPDDVWEKISPVPVGGDKGGGLLCPTCIMTRIVEQGIWTAGRVFNVERQPPRSSRLRTSMAPLLQQYADDPMWADHAEIPKLYLRKAIAEIERLTKERNEAAESRIEALSAEVGELRAAAFEEAAQIAEKWLESSWQDEVFAARSIADAIRSRAALDKGATR